MRLVGKSGARFELKILGYQFPSLVDDEWDSNWLNIRVDVNTDRGTWNDHRPESSNKRRRAPRDWLEATAEGRSLQRDLDFLEPNLSFEVMAGGSGDDVTLRAWFELELRPSWVPADEVPARAVSLVAFAERVLDAEGHAERSGTADEDVGLQTHEIEVA